MLGRPTDVGEVAAEEEAELREHRAAEWEHPLLASLAVDPERAALGVEVANLDGSEFASPDAEQMHFRRSAPQSLPTAGDAAREERSVR